MNQEAETLSLVDHLVNGRLLATCNPFLQNLLKKSFVCFFASPLDIIICCQKCSNDYNLCPEMVTLATKHILNNLNAFETYFVFCKNVISKLCFNCQCQWSHVQPLNCSCMITVWSATLKAAVRWDIRCCYLP